MLLMTYLTAGLQAPLAEGYQDILIWSEKGHTFLNNLAPKGY